MLAALSAQFTMIDWLVVVVYLALTTWIGVAMAGRQATIRDFFLGGRKLPWYAVSGSIIATEISALTFVSVPWVVFKPGGNLTYLQLGVFGTLLARILVALWLVPTYYEREIYSPYDYMGRRLGESVRGMTTALFTLGGLLGQSARIYLTAEVLIVVMHDQLDALTQTLGLNPLAWAIIILAGVSVIWTLLGGITTVIWTDVILFLAFLLGAMVALGAVVYELPGGFGELLRSGWNAVESGVPWASWGAAKTSGPWGKFTFFDFSADPTKAYTIYAAIIASTWGGIGAYGTDQLMAQRMFCCRNVRDAQKAIVASWLSIVVTALVALVGIGLYAFYQTHSPSDGARELLADVNHGDRIFPVFIVESLPIGLKGLIIAAILAAAISSVMGILTALAQTVQTAFYNPWREAELRKRGITVSLSAGAEHAAEGAGEDAEARRSVLVGRLLVVFWAVMLGLLAFVAQRIAEKYPSLLDMGLAMAGYCSGALLAGFGLAFLPRRIDGRGFLWSAPLSVLCIFAVVWHQPWAVAVCWIGALLLAALWLGDVVVRGRGSERYVLPLAGEAVAVALGLIMLLGLVYYGHFGARSDSSGKTTYAILSFPWYAPFGSLIAFLWGFALARRRDDAELAGRRIAP